MKVKNKNILSKRRGRPSQSKSVFTCSQCGYESNRRFNVDRHAVRIHTKRICKVCCNILFTRKDDFYRHKEEFHSDLIINTKVLRTKYKIFSYKESYEDINNNNYETPSIRRRSKRIEKREVKMVFKEALTDESEDGDNDDINVNCHDKDVLDDYKKFDESKSSLPSSEIPSTAINDIKEHQSTFDACENQDHYEEFSLKDTIKEETFFNVTTRRSEIYDQENRNKLPIKKRILLHEISINSINITRRYQKNEPKIKKISVYDKENQPPKNNFFNENSETVKVIVKEVSTLEESCLMWQTITQRQQDYLSYINFDNF